MNKPTQPIFHPVQQLRQDQSSTALVAAIIAILTGYGGPLAVVIQMTQAGQLSTEQTTSMLWALCVSFGLAGLILSYKTRAPIITAWSTPGAVFLTGVFSTTPLIPYDQAIAGFMIASLIILLISLSGAFDWMMNKIPKSITSALLAGILLRFGLNAFAQMEHDFYLLLIMLASYLIAKRYFARYAILTILLTGCLYAFGVERLPIPSIPLHLAIPIFTMPHFTWNALLNVGLPLALVTLTGQQMTGIAVLRASGYDAQRLPAKPLVATTSFLALITAPFGNYGINLAAITAAICTEKESHPDPSRRYIAGLWAGLFSIVLGCFAGVLVLFFSSLPKILITILAGFALLGAIMNGISNALDAQHNLAEREAALITFMVCASGVSLFGLGSAFWAIIIGSISYLILQRSHKNKTTK